MIFTTLIDWLGTFAFAVSGIRLAMGKQFDWYGAFVVGLITAIGGGTIRDFMLGVPVFWLSEPHYFIITFIALIFTVIFKKYIVHIEPELFIFDSMGIALFNVIGIDKALSLGCPMWSAGFLGVVTSVMGGMIRDIIINEVPLIMRKEIYATACLLGGAVYLIILNAGLMPLIAQIIAIALVIAIRLCAIKFNWSLSNLLAYLSVFTDK